MEHVSWIAPLTNFVGGIVYTTLKHRRMTAELRVGPLNLHRKGVELCDKEVLRLFLILDVNGDEALEMGEIVDAMARTEEERRRIDKDCLPGIHSSDCTELVQGLCAKFGAVLNLEQ